MKRFLRNGLLAVGLALGIAAYSNCQVGEVKGCRKTNQGVEICDGKDNDCDGEVDEELERLTENSCGLNSHGSIREICDEGNWKYDGCIEKDDCLAGSEDIEKCGLNGYKIRECSQEGEWGEWSECFSENECEEGKVEERDCGLSMGECEPGVQRRVCDEYGRWDEWGECKGGVGPSEEVCDEIDNNCDGKIDEEVKLTLYPDNDGDGFGDSQGEAVEGCAKENYVINNLDCDDGDDKVHQKISCKYDGDSCSQGLLYELCLERCPIPPEEICDGIDNNCNEAIDEGLVEYCYTGREETRNTGECKEGLAICEAGEWSACYGEILPKAESCDGLDNNCDGEIDDGVKKIFYEDKDGDGYGNGGVFQWSCEAPEGYVEDGSDCDDGKAEVHEIINCSYDGDSCANAGWFYQLCKVECPVPPEEVCDALDNDCDLKVDESLERVVEEMSCGYNERGKQKQICQNGNWVNSECLDPDECHDGVTRTFYTGRADTLDVGACESGTEQCLFVEEKDKYDWVITKEQVTPQRERCDGLDNDCNGKDDDVEGWWDCDWQFRKKFTIFNGAETDLEGYQTRILLDLFNQQNVQEGGADIRFTWLGEGQEKELEYWIGRWESDLLTEIWIKMPFVSKEGSEEVFMYYGNREAEGRSNYDIFEDYEGETSCSHEGCDQQRICRTSLNLSEDKVFGPYTEREKPILDFSLSAKAEGMCTTYLKIDEQTIWAHDTAHWDNFCRTPYRVGIPLGLLEGKSTIELWIYNSHELCPAANCADTKVKVDYHLEAKTRKYIEPEPTYIIGLEEEKP